MLVKKFSFILVYQRKAFVSIEILYCIPLSVIVESLATRFLGEGLTYPVHLLE